MSRESPTSPHGEAKPQPPAGSRVVNSKEGGVIRIGEDVVATIIKAEHGHVRIAIGAPRHKAIVASKQ